MNDCVKKGPYLPVGDTDWHCRTHNVDLLPTGHGGKRDLRWVCPVGEPERADEVIEKFRDRMVPP